jgi:hypothetical protein
MSRPELALVLCAAAVSGCRSGGRGGRDGDAVIVAVGEIAYPSSWPKMEHVDASTRALFDATVEELGADLLQPFAPIFGDGDLRFANLECPFTGAPPQTKESGRAFACRPDRLPMILGAGLDLFSLANNHIFDCGVDGLRDTLAALERERAAGRDLHWAGAGLTPEEATAPAVFTLPRNGMRVALFAVAEGAEGVYVAGLADDRLIERVRVAAQAVDLVIVSSHHGLPFNHVPAGGTVARYHQLIDAGATLIFGHGPHVLQGVERYGRGLIFYSLGNFSWGWPMHGRSTSHRPHRYGMLARLTVHRFGELARAEIVPLYLDDVPWVLGGERMEAAVARPVIARGVFAEATLRAIAGFSLAIPDSAPTQLTRRGDRGLVELSNGD